MFLIMKKVLFTRAHLLALCFILLLVFATAFAFSYSDNEAFADGETINISSAEEMVAFSESMRESIGRGLRVELQADVDLTGSGYLPIGSSAFNFEGVFDGNGHVLTVDINATSSDAAGVFAYTGSSCVITDLVVKGSVRGNNYVGGLVGNADGSRIEKCVSFASVTGNSYVGGLVGYCKGSLSECSSFGTITGRYSFGGTVGALQGNRSSISDSLFIGKVVSSEGSTFGGLVGSSSGALSNNYVIPTFEGSLTSYGTVIGSLGSVGNGVSYCFGVGTQKAVGANSSGSNPATLAVVTSYDMLSGGVEFTRSTLLSVCKFEVGYGFYPCPSYMLNEGSTAFIAPYDRLCYEKFKVCLFAEGTGELATPFKVTTAEHWKLFAENSRLYEYEDVHILLNANVDLGEIGGVGSAAVPFRGSLVGGGYTVTFTSLALGNEKGLFSVVSGASVSDLVLNGRVAGGGEYVGLLIGRIEGTGTTVSSVAITEDCSVSGISSVGSLVGGTSEGTGWTLSHCTSAGRVLGESYVGGLVGKARGTLVCSDCSNTGTVSSSVNGGTYVGGLFGSAVGSVSGTRLSDKGAVQAARCTYVGGIAGRISSEETFSSCYVLAGVTGRFNVGGLFGAADSDLLIKNSAYIGTVTGGNSVAAFVGELPSGKTLTIKNSYCVFDFVKDKSISLTDAFKAFCLAAPEIEKVTEGPVVGAYEYSEQTEQFTATEDATMQSGKKYYRFLSSVVTENVYYNSDIYTGKNVGGAQSKNTVALSDGTVFTDENWQEALPTFSKGYYPVPVSARKEDFSVAYFGGGEGTDASPLLISSEQHFRNFGCLFNDYGSVVSGKSFLQTTDIALTREYFTIDSFNGSYDGYDHIVSGLRIFSTSRKVGLFGEAEGRLNNICIEGAEIVALTDADALGGLVAVCRADVSNCYVAGNVTSEVSVADAGGLIGVTYGNTEVCFFDGNLTGGTCTGGLIGRVVGTAVGDKLGSGVVVGCFTTGRVEGTETVGGLIGYDLGGQLFHSSTNVILEVTDNSEDAVIGGLIGVNESTNEEGTDVRFSARVQSCLSNAWLIFGDAVIKKGGLVGYKISGNVVVGDVNSDGISDASYFNFDYARIENYMTETSGSNIVETYLSAMKIDTDAYFATTVREGETVKSFSVVGFTDEGLNVYNSAYDAKLSLRPRQIVDWAAGFYKVEQHSVRGAEMTIWKYDYSSVATDPRGSINNPYLISDGEELAVLSETTAFYAYTGKYFKIERDIDMSSVGNFYPIGFYRDSDFNYPFNGKIDGNEKTVSGLKIDFYSYQNRVGRLDGDNKYVALFGYTGSGFELKKLVLDDTCVIVGGRNSATVVGFFGGRIDQCHSSATVLSYEKTALTASTYEPGVYYTRNVLNEYVLASGEYSAETTYYGLSRNAGGFVGDIAFPGSAIVRSVFDGSIPNVPASYGFVGSNVMNLDLDTTDSWYLTRDTEYKYEESYGRALIDHADGVNKGKVEVVDDWINGFGFRVSAESEYFVPFVYNNNMDPLSSATVYRLSSSTQLKYQVRYCQQIDFVINNNDDGGEPVLHATGNKGLYYYSGQDVTATFTWTRPGYYLTNAVFIGGSRYTVGNNVLYDGETPTSFQMVNSSDNSFDLFFTMGQNASAATFAIEITLAEVDDDVVTVGGFDSVVYDKEEKEFVATPKAGFGASVVYIRDNNRSVLRDAGEYTVVVNVYWENSTVIIGRKELSCRIEKKPLSLKTTSLTEEEAAFLAALGTKEYDRLLTRVSTLSSVSLLVGLIEGDELGEGNAVLPMSVVVTWAEADSGDNVDYTLSRFDEGSDNYPNYVFTYPAGDCYAFTGGVINKKSIVVTVDGIEEEGPIGATYGVRSVEYSASRPSAPAGTYEIGVTWGYQKVKTDDVFADDTTWNGSFGVGYYRMSVAIAASENERNYLLRLSPERVFTRIYPKTVSSVVISGTDLRYDGTDLTSLVSAYYLGVGSESSTRQSVNIRFFVEAKGLTAQNYATRADGLFVRNTDNTSFVNVDVTAPFDQTVGYYEASALKNAGNYYYDCSSRNGNYRLSVAIGGVTVAKADSEEAIVFTLTNEGNAVSSGGSFDYGKKLLVTFENGSLDLDEEYDAVYSVSVVLAPGGGALVCEKESDGKWYISARSYGSGIVFRLIATGATNYNNRNSATFTLTASAVTLYVGLTHPTQTFGDPIDFSLTYYTDPDHMDPEHTIDPAAIDGLRPPQASTGAQIAEKVGSYHVAYSGGFSNGYVFNTERVPTLTIVKKTVYVSVPSEVSNAKVYGQNDPVLAYNVYADSECTEKLTVLPNGNEIVLDGKPGRQEGENVGSYDITGGTLVTSLLNTDYEVIFRENNGKFVIMQRDLRLQVKVGQSKYYGDDDQPYELEVVTGYSLARGDLISSFLSGARPVIVISRQSGERVGNYAFSVEVDYDLASKGNYNLIGVDVPDSFRIRQVTPEIEYDFGGAIYYGDTTANIDVSSARAYVNGSVVPGTFSCGQKTFNVLSDTLITLNFAPTDSVNYTSASTTFLVLPEKRPVHPVFAGNTHYPYDGRQHNDVTVTLEGLIAGSNDYNLRTTVSGDNKNVSESGFRVTVALTSPYYVFASGTRDYVECYIDPAVVTVRVENASIEFGDDYFPRITYSGFVGGETEGVLTGIASVPEIPTESGVYTLTAQGATARNYVFRYLPGILSVNKLSVENDGIDVSGVFAPGAEVEVDVRKEGTMSFSDLQEDFDKKLGGHFFWPLTSQMTSFYNISYSGLKLDDEVGEEEEEETKRTYEYRLALEKTPSSDAAFYVRTVDGQLVKLDDYTVEENELVFTSDIVTGVAVYEKKDQKTLIKGFIPLIAVGGGLILLIMIVCIIAYFKKSVGGKSKYFAQRATYKYYPHRKR